MKASNMRDSGLKVVVGLRKGGRSWGVAAKEGHKVLEVAEAAEAGGQAEPDARGEDGEGLREIPGGRLGGPGHPGRGQNRHQGQRDSASHGTPPYR